jgi:hypothetical protein
VSEIGSSKSTGQSPFNNRRDDALASLQIAVFAA